MARVQGLHAVTDSVLVGKMSIVKKQVLKSIMSLKVTENVDAKVATSPEKPGRRFRMVWHWEEVGLASTQ